MEEKDHAFMCTERKIERKRHRSKRQRGRRDYADTQGEQARKTTAQRETRTAIAG
jgi:hypothetical protein